MADPESSAPPPERERIPPPARNQWRERLLIPFASLENRNFRLLWLGQLGQASAMWADQVARSWLTWELTGSATAVGLVNLFRAIPLITLGLVGGVVADRFDKRRVLIVIQLWSLGVYAAMAVLLVGGWIQLWHIYLTAFLLGGGMAMNQPVRTSFIPQLLEGRLLVNAIALNSIAINVTRLAGPAAIGFLIAVAGGNVGPAYVVATVLYALILVTTFMIDAPSESGSRRDVPITRDLLDGFHYMLVENRMVLVLVVLAMGPLAFAMSYIVLLPVFVTEKLHMGPSAFGLLQSVSAIGALAGGLTLASMGNVPHKGRMLLITGVSYGAMVMLLGGLPVPMLAFAVVVVAGASQTVFRTANNSTLLEITPRQYQGRVVSATFLDMGVQSLAAILAGAVTDRWDVSIGFVVIGGICVLIVALVGLGVPRVRRL